MVIVWAIKTSVCAIWGGKGKADKIVGCQKQHTEIPPPNPFAKCGSPQKGFWPVFCEYLAIYETLMENF